MILLPSIAHADPVNYGGKFIRTVEQVLNDMPIKNLKQLNNSVVDDVKDKRKEKALQKVQNILNSPVFPHMYGKTPGIKIQTKFENKKHPGKECEEAHPDLSHEEWELSLQELSAVAPGGVHGYSAPIGGRSKRQRKKRKEK